MNLALDLTTVQGIQAFLVPRGHTDAHRRDIRSKASARARARTYQTQEGKLALVAASVVYLLFLFYIKVADFNVPRL